MNLIKKDELSLDHFVFKDNKIEPKLPLLQQFQALHLNEKSSFDSFYYSMKNEVELEIIVEAPEVLEDEIEITVEGFDLTEPGYTFSLNMDLIQGAEPSKFVPGVSYKNLYSLAVEVQGDGNHSTHSWKGDLTVKATWKNPKYEAYNGHLVIKDFEAWF